MATEWSSSMLVHASEEGRASRVFKKKVVVAWLRGARGGG